MIKRGTAHSKVASSSSKLWYILYAVLVLWVCSLYYYHKSKTSVQHETKVEEQRIVSPAVYKESDLGTNQARTTQLLEENVNLRAKDNHIGPVVAKKEEAHAPSLSVQGTKEKDRMHIVFSTDCSFFQDWQTLLVFHSAMKAGQQGEITRIASGCAEEKQQELTQLYKTLFPQYHVHFTPDFKTDGKTKKKYDFYNKPYGLHHWLQHAQPPIDDGVVVILIDPDMIILRPFSLDFASNPLNIFYDKSIKPGVSSVPAKIGKGVPVAQVYGLGAPWAEAHNNNFNRTAVCGVGSPCHNVKVRFGELHYSVGPPYLVEKSDLLAITDSWTEFVPRVYERYPELLAEMYAYSMAAAHNELPHYIMRHFMVSNIDMDEEGWKYIDVFQDDVCEPPVDGVYYPGKPLPNILHFCQFYRSGEFGFQKRRVRKSLFECEKPLMAAIPRDQGTVRYKNRDGDIMKLGPKQGRRGAFMLCALHSAINDMVLYYRSVMCGTDQWINRNETVNLVSKEYWRRK